MADRLVVHIGDFKTGSTSIQIALEQGLFHGADRVVFPGSSDDHRELARAIRARNTGPVAQERSARLAAACRDTPGEVAVLSAEHFASLDPALLLDWLNTWLPQMAAKTRIISYVRPHAAFLVSTWAEQTKLGVNRYPLEGFLHRFLKSPVITYQARFSPWQSLFGDRFSLRPMIRDLLQDGDVVVDFLRQILDRQGAALTMRTRANTQLSFEDLEFLRLLHAQLRARNALAGRATRNAFGNRMQTVLQQLGPRADHHPVTLMQREVRRIRDTCAADAAAMDAQFFSGTPLSDALEQTEAQATPRPKPARPVQMRHLLAVARLQPSFLPIVLRQTLIRA